MTGPRRSVRLSATERGAEAARGVEMTFGIVESGIVLVLSGLLIMTVGYAARARPIGPVLIGIGVVVSLAVVAYYVVGSLRY